MRDPFDDDAREIMLAALDDDDITPIEGARPPRGRAQRGTVSVALDQCSGEFVGSNKPTADPPDLAVRRPKWAGMYRVMKENE